MEILELINKNFSLNDKDKITLDQIASNVVFAEKDESILKNLIYYKLDTDSVFAYFICEYNLFDVVKTDNAVLEIAQNLKYVQENDGFLNKNEDSELLRKQFIAMCYDIRVIIIKLCLVLHEAEMMTLPINDLQKDFLLTIRNIYAPLSERLGLNKLKSHLEDICLKLLNNKIYTELEQNVLLKKEENEKQIEITKQKLQNIIEELNLPNAKIMARQKHFSSIYKKIQNKNIPIAKIYDLIAMRVIVETVEQCYAVLGKIHAIYKPMEGRFKDYISNPKINGYQSLHTTVIVENNRPLEIQIRTFEMHQNSEFGVNVAHWIYKENKKTTELDKKLSWLRKIMDNAENLSSDEFIETLKTNLYSGRVFVQTPKGKVLEFPEGSSVIDFAYCIHSDIGNKCVGCKINNKMAPLNTKLKNNDIVEIITSQNSKGPSRDWINLVKTSEARSKINLFFKKQMHAENIKLGKQILEVAIKNKGYTPSKLLDKNIIAKVLQKYMYNSEDEMYASIGFGSMSTTQIIGKLVREFEKQEKTYSNENIKAVVVKKNKDGVLIDGDSGMLIRFAGCCSPVIGEEIIGYISRGRGVTIHKSDCDNIKYLEPERFISAKWSDDTAGFEIKTLVIIAMSNDNVISKIIQVVANSNFGVLALETKNNADNIICTTKIKHKKGDNIQKLMTNIKQINGVLEINTK